MKTALPTMRLSSTQKEMAMYAAELFATEVDATLVNDSLQLESTGYTVELAKEGYSVGADVVKCPQCKEINVVWGQFGDPATEIAVCIYCHNEFVSAKPF